MFDSIASKLVRKRLKRGAHIYMYIYIYMYMYMYEETKWQLCRHTMKDVLSPIAGACHVLVLANFVV